MVEALKGMAAALDFECLKHSRSFGAGIRREASGCASLADRVPAYAYFLRWIYGVAALS
jgi:hypothetical protein